MAGTTEQRSTVVGIFADRRQADLALGDLHQAGFREDQIRVEETRYCGGEFPSERTVVAITVEANGLSDEATSILRRDGASDLHTPATASRTGEGARIQLREEELRAHKQLVETGEVRVRKEVVTEHRTIEVPVQREEIIIERHAPTGAPDSASDLRPGEEIRIPVWRERVSVEKRPVVREEVTVGKRLVQDTERVGGEVRKEEVRVERIEREENEDVHAATTQPRDAQAASEHKPPVLAKEDEEALILRRAHLKWLGEGCPEGQDLRHYFEAEREVRA